MVCPCMTDSSLITHVALSGGNPTVPAEPLFEVNHGTPLNGAKRVHFILSYQLENEFAVKSAKTTCVLFSKSGVLSISSIGGCQGGLLYSMIILPRSDTSVGH